MPYPRVLFCFYEPEPANNTVDMAMAMAAAVVFGRLRVRQPHGRATVVCRAPSTQAAMEVFDPLNGPFFTNTSSSTSGRLHEAAIGQLSRCAGNSTSQGGYHGYQSERQALQ